MAANAMPIEARAAQEQLEAYGFKSRYVPAYELAQLSPERRLQVRDSHKAEGFANKRLAAQYGNQLKHGVDGWPPIIVTEDKWLVDGNTRTGGCLTVERPVFPALVVEGEYGKMPPAQRFRLESLFGTINQKNGARLSPSELNDYLKHQVRNGATKEQLEQRYGVSQSAISNAQREVRFEKRADEVGYDNDDIKSTVKRELARGPIMDNLSNEEFKAFTTLSIDAGLEPKEISETFKEIRAEEPAARANKIAQLRQDNEERIVNLQTTGKAAQGNAQQLRRYLGWIVKFTDSPHELIETNPDVIDKHTEAIETAITVLQGVLNAQK
jgi:hypothetical protein